MRQNLYFVLLLSRIRIWFQSDPDDQDHYDTSAKQNPLRPLFHQNTFPYWAPEPGQGSHRPKQPLLFTKIYIIL